MLGGGGDRIIFFFYFKIRKGRVIDILLSVVGKKEV